MKQITCAVLTADAPVSLIPSKFLTEIANDSGCYQSVRCTAVLSEIQGFLVLVLPAADTDQQQMSLILRAEHVLAMMQGEEKTVIGFLGTGATR